MSEDSSGCGCCPDCTGEPGCTCGCPDCVFCDYDDCDCCCDMGGECYCGESKFVLSAVSSIVGMLFMGVLAILYSIGFLNDALDVTVIIGTDMGFTLFCAAGVLAFCGVLSLKAGDLTEGILFSLVGLSALILNGGMILGFGPAGYFDWIALIVILIVAIILITGRDITFGISVLLFCGAWAFATVFGAQDFTNYVSGIFYLIAGILLVYVAVSDWIFVETGTDLPIL